MIKKESKRKVESFGDDQYCLTVLVAIYTSGNYWKNLEIFHFDQSFQSIVGIFPFSEFHKLKKK